MRYLLFFLLFFSLEESAVADAPYLGRDAVSIENIGASSDGKNITGNITIDGVRHKNVTITIQPPVLGWTLVFTETFRFYTSKGTLIKTVSKSKIDSIKTNNSEVAVSGRKFDVESIPKQQSVQSGQASKEVVDVSDEKEKIDVSTSKTSASTAETVVRAEESRAESAVVTPPVENTTATTVDESPPEMEEAEAETPKVTTKEKPSENNAQTGWFESAKTFVGDIASGALEAGSAIAGGVFEGAKKIVGGIFGVGKETVVGAGRSAAAAVTEVDRQAEPAKKLVEDVAGTVADKTKNAASAVAAGAKNTGSAIANATGQVSGAVLSGLKTAGSTVKGIFVKDLDKEAQKWAGRSKEIGIPADIIKSAVTGSFPDGESLESTDLSKDNNEYTCIDVTEAKTASNINNENRSTKAFSVEAGRTLIEDSRGDVAEKAGTAAPILADVNRSIIDFKDDLTVQRQSLQDLNSNQQQYVADYISYTADQQRQLQSSAFGQVASGELCSLFEGNSLNATQSALATHGVMLVAGGTIGKNIQGVLGKLDLQTGILNDYLFNVLAHQGDFAEALKDKNFIIQSSLAVLQKVLQRGCKTTGAEYLAGSLAGLQAIREGMKAVKAYENYTKKEDPENSRDSLQKAQELVGQLNNLGKVIGAVQSIGATVEAAKAATMAGNPAPCAVVSKNSFAQYTQIAGIILQALQMGKAISDGNLDNAEMASEILGLAGNVAGFGAQVSKEHSDTLSQLSKYSEGLSGAARLFSDNARQSCQGMTANLSQLTGGLGAAYDQVKGTRGGHYNVPLGYKYVGGGKACKNNANNAQLFKTAPAATASSYSPKPESRSAPKPKPPPAIFSVFGY